MKMLNPLDLSVRLEVLLNLSKDQNLSMTASLHIERIYWWHWNVWETHNRIVVAPFYQWLVRRRV